MAPQSSPVPADQGGPAPGPDGRLRNPWALQDPLLTAYYDDEWGRPVRDERGLFERLTLEAFQSGLSWLIVLRKRPALRAGFADFDPEAVARFGTQDVERLMADPGIIRNRRKIQAAIANARAVLALREDPDGDLARLIWSHQPAEPHAPRTVHEVPAQTPASAALARALKAKGLRFVGPTTAQAAMEAIGLVDSRLVGTWNRGLT